MIPKGGTMLPLDHRPISVANADNRINLWKNVALANNGTYLGIRFGEVTTEMIFDKAIKKFRKRFGEYRPMFKRLPIHKRTLLANVFLLTLFSYVGQFYIVPPDIYKEVKEGLRKAVIPFGGGAFAYAHAVNENVASTRLARPLKDLWALNMTWLAAKTPLDSCHAKELASFEGFEHVNGDDWGTGYLSLRPAEHRIHAAIIYLDDYGARVDGAIQSELLTRGAKATRRTIYNTFASAGWNDHLSSKSMLKLRAKLKKWGVDQPEEEEAVVGMRSNDLRPRVSPQAWDFFIRLLFRALPFEKRMIDANMKDTLDSEFVNLCYYCGDGPDSAYHVYRDCKVVKTIRSRCLDTNEAHDINQVLIARRTTSKQETRAMLLVNYSVWRIRQDFLMTQSGRPTPEAIHARSGSHSLCWFDAGGKTETNYHGNT
jgi:hypothetical protein